MKVAIALILLASLYAVYAQNSWTADFEYSTPEMGVGILPGKFSYHRRNSPLNELGGYYKVVYSTLEYTLLYHFNQYWGENTNLIDPYVKQWRFRSGPGCPGGCETGRVTNSIPVLYYNTTVYNDDNVQENIKGRNCFRYTLKSTAPKSGVNQIWFTAESTSGQVCKVTFTDGSSYTFTNNANVAETAWGSTFTSPSGCTCSNPVDIGLILDRSGSIKIKDWNNMYNFLQGFASSFKWAPDKGNLAIVNFNTEAFGQYKNGVYMDPPLLPITGDSNAIINTIKSLNCCLKGGPDDECCKGWTSIAAGVRAGVNELAKSSRPQTTKVVLLLTDGKQNTLYSTDPVGNSCYKECCDKGWAVGNGCPDDVYGPPGSGRYPGAQYLYCLGDRNYDSIVDDWDNNYVGKPQNFACGNGKTSDNNHCRSTNNNRNEYCGCPNRNTCCKAKTDPYVSDYGNCNATGCTDNPDYQKNSMKTCHLDLINAREYGFKRLGSDTIFYSVGVGDVSRTELNIIANNMFKRPSNVNPVEPITWTPKYNPSDNTNPERVMTATSFDQLAGLLLELTTKICDEPATPCGTGCCGYCICGECQAPATCATPDEKCMRAVLRGPCCNVEPISCPDQNCKIASCNNATGCVYNNRACTPAQDACYTYSCVTATNQCSPTPKWQPAPNQCYRSYCDTTNPNNPVLVVNQPKDCSGLDDKCTTYSCQNSTGNCVPKTIPFPTNNDPCKYYVCDVTKGFELKDKVCNAINKCNTARCDSNNNGVCVQTPIICKDPTDECETTACNPAAAGPACPTTKTYKTCTASSDKCVGPPVCNKATGECDFPARKTCVQEDCRRWDCNANNNVCEPLSTSSCTGICNPATPGNLNCSAQSNMCLRKECNLTSTTFATNCEISIDLAALCPSIYNKTEDKCIDTVTCDPAVGCVATRITENDCPPNTDKCFKYILNTTLDGCCQLVPTIQCNLGDPCYNYRCVPETGECEVTPKCDMNSTNCTIKGCNPDGTCFNNPVICLDVNCYDNLGCIEKLGGCQKTAKNCDDKDECTFDVCNNVTNKCTNAPIPCETSNKCLIAVCDKTSGCSYKPVDCSDGFNCTLDTCDPKVGCEHEPVDSYCEDNNLCTNQTCVVGEGCVYKDVVCKADQPCIDPVCQPTFGCRNLQTLCILNDKDEAVKAYNPDLDDISTPEEKAKKVAQADQAAKDNDKRRKDKKDCSFAVCDNSTCVKKELECAASLEQILIPSVLAAGAIVGIVIAALIVCLGAGGGAYYVTKGGGISNMGNVHNSPLFKSAGNTHENVLADPTL